MNGEERTSTWPPPEVAPCAACDHIHSTIDGKCVALVPFGPWWTRCECKVSVR